MLNEKLNGIIRKSCICIYNIIIFKHLDNLIYDTLTMEEQIPKCFIQLEDVVTHVKITIYIYIYKSRIGYTLSIYVKYMTIGYLTVNSEQQKS